MKRFGIAGAALMVAAGLAGAPGPSAAPARPLEVYFVDVEGGAATLTVTPSGESVLVDSGWPREDGRDAKRIEHAARYVAGLSRIDHYVTTHWHTDHYGGIEHLARLMPVKHYWDRGIPDTLSDDPTGFPILISAYRRANAGRSNLLEAGDALPLGLAGAPLTLKVVAASGRVIGEGKNAPDTSCDRHPAKPVDTSDNAKSLALLLDYGRFQFLNCGDLTWNIEHKLVCPKNRVGKVDLFQVTHHGADQSNNPALIEAVEPRCAVMCNGPRKGGAASTVATLKRTKSLEGFYQLHRNLTTGPQDNTAPERIANLEEACKGEFIRVRLAPEGDRYTVSIGANKPVQTIAVR
jgi:competence protein ComEC